jgi:hypothetical protein
MGCQGLVAPERNNSKCVASKPADPLQSIPDESVSKANRLADLAARDLSSLIDRRDCSMSTSQSGNSMLILSARNGQSRRSYITATELGLRWVDTNLRLQFA